MAQLGLSESARRLLKRLHHGWGLGEQYEGAEFMRMLFSSSEECVKAQEELESAGLIELGLRPPSWKADCVRDAALTPKGVRYLQANADDPPRGDH